MIGSVYCSSSDNPVGCCTLGMVSKCQCSVRCCGNDKKSIWYGVWKDAKGRCCVDWSSSCVETSSGFNLEKVEEEQNVSLLKVSLSNPDNRFVLWNGCICVSGSIGFLSLSLHSGLTCYFLRFYFQVPLSYESLYFIIMPFFPFLHPPPPTPKLGGPTISKHQNQTRSVTNLQIHGMIFTHFYCVQY